VEGHLLRCDDFGRAYWLLDGLQLLVLVLYAIFVAVAAQGSDKALGLATGICVYILDILAWYYKKTATVTG